MEARAEVPPPTTDGHLVIPECEAATLLRGFDWGGTPVGPSGGWPVAVKTAAAMALASPSPTFVFWGPDLNVVYNDGAIPLLGDRHPAAFGAPAAPSWLGLGDRLGTAVAGVLRDGRARSLDEGGLGFTLGPLPGGGSPGVFCTVQQATTRQLRLAVDTVPALISYVGADLRYGMANATYERWFGVPQRDISGRHVREVLGEAAWEAVRPYMERALGGEVVTYEQALPYRGGGTRDVHVTYVPDFHGDEVAGFVVMVTDVSERKRAEQNLREAREQLQLVTDTMPVFVARCDRERRFVWTNKSYAARFGLTPEELAGRPVRAVLGESAMQAITPRIDQVLAGQPVDFEAEVPFDQLGSRWMHVRYAPTFDASGETSGWVAAVLDITHRRDLEEALRRSEERYRSLTEAITSVVWTASADGRFVEPQPAWEAYTGQPWREHGGVGWMSAFHPEDRARLGALWDESCKTQRPHHATGRLWHARSRTYRHFECRAVPIHNPDGSVREWIGKYLDVDERERALEELQEAGRRKDEFLAMLAHELRNPLAPILNAVELLRRRGPDDEILANNREVIARQVQHMKRLLDDLLDVARVSRGKIQLRKERLDLSTPLLHAVEVSRPLIASKGHDLTVEVAPQPLPVEGDPTRLTQIFANLLNNAAKYTDPGGAIHLTARAESGTAVIRVRDTGVGMSPELLERAFDLFAQADRSLDRAQGGLGIGLTMVRSLCTCTGEP